MTTETTGTETVPQMRERIDQLIKENKASQAKLLEVSRENRRLLARDAFREAGYLPAHGELYASQVAEDELDVSMEAINEFAQRFSLAAVQSGQEAPPPVVTEKSTPTDTALAGMSRSGSRPGEGGQPAAGLDRTISRDDWIELSKSDPVAARKAVQEGRVQIRKDNPFVARKR